MISLAALLLATAIAVGLYQGRTETNPRTRAFTAALFLAVSNLLACWPYFVVGDPSSWPRTYVSGLLFTGWASFLVHSLPFLLAWQVGRWIWRSRTA